jgi:hypothetical protein
MARTTASVFARLKVEHPLWALSRTESTFLAVHRTNGRRRITATSIGDFEQRLYLSDGGERQRPANEGPSSAVTG